MSKKNREHHHAPPPPAPVGPHIVALKPQRRLLVIVSVIFALWVGLLLTMYFTTIYPIRHERTLPSSVDNPK
jgi:hypothetical protein